MNYEGLIDDNHVLNSLIACSMNYETAVTFTYGHFNKVVFAVWWISLFPRFFALLGWAHASADVGRRVAYAGLHRFYHR